MRLDLYQNLPEASVDLDDQNEVEPGVLKSNLTDLHPTRMPNN